MSGNIEKENDPTAYEGESTETGRHFEPADSAFCEDSDEDKVPPQAISQGYPVSPADYAQLKKAAQERPAPHTENAQEDLTEDQN